MSAIVRVEELHPACSRWKYVPIILELVYFSYMLGPLSLPYVHSGHRPRTAKLQERELKWLHPTKMVEPVGPDLQPGGPSSGDRMERRC